MTKDNIVEFIHQFNDRKQSSNYVAKHIDDSRAGVYRQNNDDPKFVVKSKNNTLDILGYRFHQLTVDEAVEEALKII